MGEFTVTDLIIVIMVQLLTHTFIEMSETGSIAVDNRTRLTIMGIVLVMTLILFGGMPDKFYNILKILGGLNDIVLW